MLVQVFELLASNGNPSRAALALFERVIHPVRPATIKHHQKRGTKNEHVCNRPSEIPNWLQRHCCQPLGLTPAETQTNRPWGNALILCHQTSMPALWLFKAVELPRFHVMPWQPCMTQPSVARPILPMDIAS